MFLLLSVYVSGCSLGFYFLLSSESDKINSYQSCINLRTYYQDKGGFFTLFYCNENGNISERTERTLELNCIFSPSMSEYKTRTKMFYPDGQPDSSSTPLLELSAISVWFYFCKHSNWFQHANVIFLSSCQVKSYTGGR